MANQVNVNTTNNQVTVTQGTTQIVTVSAQGPQGIQGPAGAAGPSGSVANTGSFATTGSNSFIGDQIITGSLIISGSSTFTNIGPAVFSGSLNITEGITGSFSGTATSASFAITASHALFAISASHEVIKEVSSSHANFADSAGGLSGIPSIVINQITASGDISASSATITALTGSFNHIITDDDTIEFRNKNTGVQTGRLKFDPTTGLNVQDNTGARTKIRAGRGEFLSLEAGPVGFNSLGSITASVDISASGDIVGSNLSGTNTGDQDLSNLVTNSSTASFAITGSDVIFGNITSSGNISASGNIIGDTVTTSGNITSGDRVIATGRIIGGSSVSGTEGIFTTITNVNTTHITASGNISASGDIIANKVTADVVDTSFETFLNFEAATAFTFIAPFPLTINFTGSSTSSMDVAGFVTASANTSTFSVQQTPPITLNIFDKLKITPSSSGLFSFSGSRTI